MLAFLIRAVLIGVLFYAGLRFARGLLRLVSAPRGRGNVAPGSAPRKQKSARFDFEEDEVTDVSFREREAAQEETAEEVPERQTADKT